MLGRSSLRSTTRRRRGKLRCTPSRLHHQQFCASPRLTEYDGPRWSYEALRAHIETAASVAKLRDHHLRCAERERLRPNRRKAGLDELGLETPIQKLLRELWLRRSEICAKHAVDPGWSITHEIEHAEEAVGAEVTLGGRESSCPRRLVHFVEHERQEDAIERVACVEFQDVGVDEVRVGALQSCPLQHRLGEIDRGHFGAVASQPASHRAGAATELEHGGAR